MSSFLLATCAARKSALADCFLDDGVGPDLCDQFIFTDDTTIGLHQHREDFERPSSNAQWPSIKKGFALFQGNGGLTESDHALLCTV
ncbi:hypothetical protein C4K18_3584 [Pseudomonas chlororaphis subsp. aurantiaca]|nr:hypothetical protein C4K18_3584 [Pseudomonas chlororaphis subsp. aurantiaca]